MKRILSLIGALLIALSAVSIAISSSYAAGSPTESVVVILAPYLRWSDIDEASTPTLYAMARDGAVGDVNGRSRVRQSITNISPLEGALSISAGAWAVTDPVAASAYSVDEAYEVGNAAEAYQRTTGEQVLDNTIVFLGHPATQRANAEIGPDAVLGTLGQAVYDAGGFTAAIGNSDVGYVTGDQKRVRPAALAAMNEIGLVRAGDISRRLLREDPNAPFGVATDLKRFEQTNQEVARMAAEQDGPVLVVLDSGDGYRAQRFRPQVTDRIAESHRIQAARTVDSVAKIARDSFPGAVIMVVSSTNGDPDFGEPEGLGPVIVSGAGWSGYVTSNSTQREGLVTDLDVSATALEVLGIDRPVRVLGNGMYSSGTGGLDARVSRLTLMNQTAIAVDKAKPAVVNTFVALTVIILLFATLILVRGRLWSLRLLRVMTRFVRGALLLIACVPLSSWLSLLVNRWPTTSAEATLWLVGTCLVVWVTVAVLFRKHHIRLPIAVISLTTVGVILIDQWLGAPASFTNFFSYSPLLGARFYGMGNEAAAIVFGAAVVGVSLLFDQWLKTRPVSMAKRFGLPVLGFVVVATAAAPFFGANVGVVIWGLVGFILAWVLMNGYRVSFKTVLLTILGIVILIGAFAAIDIFGSGGQTHLARSLQSASQGGLGELWLIVVRKAATNVRVLTRTNWAYILIATLAFFAVMRWRPHGDFAATLDENPHFADAITVSLVAGVVAYFTEDSGIVIPALEVFYVGVALAGLMLERQLARLSVLPSESAGGMKS